MAVRALAALRNQSICMLTCVAVVAYGASTDDHQVLINLAAAVFVVVATAVVVD